MKILVTGGSGFLGTHVRSFFGADDFSRKSGPLARMAQLINKEKNRYEQLQNIEFELFFLNHSAKITFANKMGISTVNYGSVSLYKNNFFRE